MLKQNCLKHTKCVCTSYSFQFSRNFCLCLGSKCQLKIELNYKYINTHTHTHIFLQLSTDIHQQIYIPTIFWVTMVICFLYLLESETKKKPHTKQNTKNQQKLITKTKTNETKSLTKQNPEKYIFCHSSSWQL